MEQAKPKTNREQKVLLRLTKSILFWGIVAVFVIAPFYAPLAVLLATHWEHFDLLKIWKEIALAAMGVVLAIFMMYNRKLAQNVFRDRLFQLILAYGLVVVGRGVYDLVTGGVVRDAVIYGLLLDLRHVGFFSLVFLAVSTGQLKRAIPWRKLVLIPATLVIVFGFLQVSVLPKDVLSHIGYSKQTITPYQSVDNRPDFVRVQSTLRGPNPLGAYLTLIISLIATLGLAAIKRHQRWWWLLGVLTLIVLFGTYSRSAWIGTVLSLAALFILHKKRSISKRMITTASLMAVVFLVGIFMLRSTYFLQNVLFHSSNKSTSQVSSNAARAASLQDGLKQVIHAPAGKGVGSAGPASFRNNGEVRIAENYFIQLGQEVGILGLGFFVAIQIVLLLRFYRAGGALAYALLASLIGLTFVNMVSHAWTDDTLAYCWWGLAGIALGSQTGILNRKHHEKETKT